MNYDEANALLAAAAAKISEAWFNAPQPIIRDGAHLCPHCTTDLALDGIEEIDYDARTNDAFFDPEESAVHFRTQPSEYAPLCYFCGHCGLPLSLPDYLYSLTW